MLEQLLVALKVIALAVMAFAAALMVIILLETMVGGDDND
jgi:hypothetical protein